MSLLVSVHMITYNHEKYIEQAIEGVLMQKTSFAYELVISDDCSPDNTIKIIKQYQERYPGIIRVIDREKNLGSMTNFIDTFGHCKGKYIAICEGDDYWTDPLKLEKQVGFLEANSDFGIVYTDSLAYYQFNDKFEILEKPKNRQDSFFKDLICSSADIYTLTVCFRKAFIQDYVNEIQPDLKKWLMGDLPLWLYISNKSEVYYIDEVTSVYRVLEESASNTKNLDKYLAFKDSAFEIRLFFLDKYSKDNLKLKKYITSIYLYERLVWNILFKGDFRQFLNFLHQFYIGNTNFKFFIGSFYQTLKKIRSQIID